MSVPIETACEVCGKTYWQGDVMEYLTYTCDSCLEDSIQVWLSDGKVLLGPIQCSQVKKHPNASMTFQVTDPDWLVRLGWGPSAYVEIQANALVPGIKTPRDTYWWSHSSV